MPSFYFFIYVDNLCHILKNFNHISPWWVLEYTQMYVVFKFLKKENNMEDFTTTFFYIYFFSIIIFVVCGIMSFTHVVRAIIKQQALRGKRVSVSRIYLTVFFMMTMTAIVPIFNTYIVVQAVLNGFRSTYLVFFGNLINN